MNTVLLTVAVALGLKLVAELCLSALNRKEVQRNADTIPQSYRDMMDDETYRKSVRYTLAHNRLSMLQSAYDTLILAVVLFSGLLPVLFDSGADLFGTGIWGVAATLFALLILLSFPGIPFELYDQFVLEERFGFNKSSFGLWVTDKLKGIAIGAVLAVPMIALLLWLVESLPLWWVWAFAAFFLFQLLMIVLYPMFIMPLFNKFEPLEEGDLRTRLMRLAERTGFSAKTVLVMDGSKRSAHSNAFFTGFGKLRRIVLFDTLIEQLSERELEAVLAHEIGHYKLGHIPRMLILSAVVSFVGFAFLGWLVEASWFVEAFGFSAEGGLGPVLLLFMLVGGVFTYWLGPLSNILSRKHEYEADAYARKMMEGDPAPLQGALRRLSQKNLSNLTPHPAFSGFYYSHPTLAEREAALKTL